MSSVKYLLIRSNYSYSLIAQPKHVQNAPDLEYILQLYTNWFDQVHVTLEVNYMLLYQCYFDCTSCIANYIIARSMKEGKLWCQCQQGQGACQEPKRSLWLCLRNPKSSIIIHHHHISSSSSIIIYITSSSSIMLHRHNIASSIIIIHHHSSSPIMIHHHHLS